MEIMAQLALGGQPDVFCECLVWFPDEPCCWVLWGSRYLKFAGIVCAVTHQDLGETTGLWRGAGVGLAGGLGHREM